MDKMTRMCDMVEDELGKIADKGLNMSNLETAYKLADIYKDLKTVEAMDEGGYSEKYDGYGMGSYDRAGSYGRTRHVRNRYSMSGAGEDMADRLDDIMRDASPEDRRVLERFAGKLRGV